MTEGGDAGRLASLPVNGGEGCWFDRTQVREEGVVAMEQQHGAASTPELFFILPRERAEASLPQLGWAVWPNRYSCRSCESSGGWGGGRSSSFLSPNTSVFPLSLIDLNCESMFQMCAFAHLYCGGNARCIPVLCCPADPGDTRMSPLVS